MAKKQGQDTEFHFFSSSFFNWCCDADFETCCKRQRTADRAASRHGMQPSNFHVYKVPGPASREYEIVHYRPAVEGVELIHTETYDWSEATRRRRSTGRVA